MQISPQSGGYKFWIGLAGAFAMPFLERIGINMKPIIFVIGAASIACIGLGIRDWLKNIRITKAEKPYEQQTFELWSKRAVIASALAIIILSSACYYLVFRQTGEASISWETAKKVPVVGRTFANQRVLLDGFSYSNCTFVNVTLVYNGTAPFDINHNNFEGSIVTASDKPNIRVLLRVLKELNYFRTDLKTFGD